MIKSAELMKKALSLASHSKGSFVELAESIQALHKENPDQIKRFIEQSGLGRSKAYYLLKIHNQFAQSGQPSSRLNNIGWTKLQIIAKEKKPTRSNADRLLTLAEKNTAHKLKLLMRGEKPKRKTHAVLMYFSPQQYRQFEVAVLAHGARSSRHGRGLVNKEQALIKIIKQSH
jgi:hypothetical protein